MPESRRQRKDKLKSSSLLDSNNESESINTAHDIPLARPPKPSPNTRSNAPTKTLVDLVEEYASKLKMPDGSSVLPPSAEKIDFSGEEDGDSPDLSEDTIENIPLFLIRAVITAFPLALFNLLMTYLITSLYEDNSNRLDSQTPTFLKSVLALLPQTLTKTFPLLVLLSFSLQIFGNLTNIKDRKLKERLSQIGWCLVSIVAGCWMVFVVERRGYMAVMKFAPGAATVWIWSNVEMNVEGCMLSAVLVIAWAAFLGAFS